MSAVCLGNLQFLELGKFAAMKTLAPSSQLLRQRFYLVELVVVVLVFGTIAATAAPKMFNTAGDRRENSTLTSLAVIRDAIDLHRGPQVGVYPGDSGTEADLKTDLEPFLRGPFPLNQIPDAATMTAPSA